MHLGIIGAGHVGGTLGQRFLSASHTVTFGARDPAKTRTSLAHPAFDVGPISDLRTCDAVLLATPWAGAVEALTSLAPSPGQISIDATNPIAGRLEPLAMAWILCSLVLGAGRRWAGGHACDPLNTSR